MTVPGSCRHAKRLKDSGLNLEQPLYTRASQLHSASTYARVHSFHAESSVDIPDLRNRRGPIPSAPYLIERRKLKMPLMVVLKSAPTQTFHLGWERGRERRAASGAGEMMEWAPPCQMVEHSRHVSDALQECVYVYACLPFCRLILLILYIKI